MSRLPIELKPEPGHRGIDWQKVFAAVHEAAVLDWPPGTRYEIRLLGHPFAYVIRVHDPAMNLIEPWTNTPEQTPEYFRVSRCIVQPKKEPP